MLVLARATDSIRERIARLLGTFSWLIISLCTYACGGSNQPLSVPPTVAGKSADGGHKKVAGCDMPATNPCPSDMMVVPEGTPFLGDDSSLEREPRAFEARLAFQPIHVRSFCIDLNEVSVADYGRCVESHTCRAPGPSAPLDYPANQYLHPQFVFRDPRPDQPLRHGHTQMADCLGIMNPQRNGEPISCVDHADAAVYCKFKGKRLPTIEEWQFGAVGCDRRQYPSLDIVHLQSTSPDDTDAGFDEISRIEQMGVRRIDFSPFGARDMMGSVREWTATLASPWRESGLTGGPLPTVSGDYYAVCGQSSADIRVAQSSGKPPLPISVWFAAHASERSEKVGFRCAADAAGGGE